MGVFGSGTMEKSWASMDAVCSKIKGTYPRGVTEDVVTSS